eukprot:TRINITY_DN30166_c0_g1_i1.p1 TRINITY_DN30166_c0_g1~~TRINITY_DN30166_c0_g1_i1.p1  ORF type:complete len:199 (-),score=44.02 TRINITY_DN30166_c0_g1_i1:122-694(-)
MATKLENQPYWARDLLRNEADVEEDEDIKDLEEQSRLHTTARSSEDLIHKLRLGEGSGLLVDEALARSWPRALSDIKQLISTSAVRHVQPQLEVAARTRGAKAAAEKAAAVASLEHPLGLVLYPCFEPEVEALKVDADICEAFHAVSRPQQGSVGARIMPKQVEAEGPKKRARRAPQKPRKVQNAHMSSG